MSRVLVPHDAPQAAQLLADDPDLQPTLRPDEFDERFLALHRQLFRTDEPDFYEVTTHVYRPPAPYHIADHQFLWDGSRWHLLYVTGDISRIDAYRRHMEEGRLDQAAAESPEVGIGHARGDSLGTLAFHRNLLAPVTGRVRQGDPRRAVLLPLRADAGECSTRCAAKGAITRAWRGRTTCEDWASGWGQPRLRAAVVGAEPGRSGAGRLRAAAARRAVSDLLQVEGGRGAGRGRPQRDARLPHLRGTRPGVLLAADAARHDRPGVAVRDRAGRDVAPVLHARAGDVARGERPADRVPAGRHLLAGRDRQLPAGPLPRRRGVQPRRPLVHVDDVQGAVASGEPPSGAALLPGHLRGRDRPGGRGVPERNRVGRRSAGTGESRSLAKPDLEGV